MQIFTDEFKQAAKQQLDRLQEQAVKAGKQAAEWIEGSVKREARPEPQRGSARYRVYVEESFGTEYIVEASSAKQAEELVEGSLNPARDFPYKRLVEKWDVVEAMPMWSDEEDTNHG